MTTTAAISGTNTLNLTIGTRRSQLLLNAALSDVETIPGDGDAALVVALSEFGHLEVAAIDANGHLDVSAGTAMRALFNDGVAKYVAIQWQGDKFYALDSDGYLHVYASGAAAEGYFRTANPIFMPSQLSNLKTASLVLASGNVSLRGTRSDASGSSYQLQAATTIVSDTELLNLSFEVVQPRSGAAQYLLRDGVLYTFGAERIWRQSDSANLAKLRSSAAGGAVAIKGSDQLLRINPDGSTQTVNFSVAGGVIVDADIRGGSAYALGSDGTLYVNGGAAQSSLAFAGLDAGDAVTGFALSAGGSDGYVVTRAGRLMSFTLAAGATQVALTAVSAAGRGNRAVFLDNSGRMILVQSAGSQVSYSSFDTAARSVTPLIDAAARSFTRAVDIGGNSVINSSDGRRYTVVDGRVMYYANASQQWLPTATNGVQRLVLGADSKLYALLMDHHLAQLNEFGFLQGGGEQLVDPVSKQVLYARKSIALPAGVQQFAVTALGSIVYLDQDGALKRVDLQKTEYGTATVAELDSAAPAAATVSAAGVLDADGVALVKIDFSAREAGGRSWVVSGQRVFFSDTPADARSWRETTPISKDQKVTGFSTLKDGRIGLNLSDSKSAAASVALFDGSWFTVKSATDLALPVLAGTMVKSIAVDNSGKIVVLYDNGKVQQRGVNGSSGWGAAAEIPAGVVIQQLQVLADGSVVGRQADNRVFRLGADSWQETVASPIKPDFDVLYDQINYARGDFSSSALFFGGGEKSTKKPANLPTSVREEVPSKGARWAGWANWWTVHFRPSTGIGEFHGEIKAVKAELAQAWERLAHNGALASQPGNAGGVDSITNSAVKAAFETYRKKIDSGISDALQRLQKELGFIDRNGNPVADFDGNIGRFSSLKPDSPNNVIKALYDQRVGLFGAADPIATTLGALLNAKVYLALDSGDLSALTGKLVEDADAIGEAFRQSFSEDRAMTSTTNPRSADAALTALKQSIDTIEAARKGSKINLIVKNNVLSLEQADQFFRTFDYLEQGLGNDNHKLQRSLTRAGAVQGDVVAQYVRMIQSMAVGDTLELKSGWGLSANLSVGASVPKPFSLGPVLSGGGGREYRVSFEKTETGLKLKISFSVKGNVSVGLGAGVQFADSTKDKRLNWAVAGAAVSLDGSWAGTWESSVTMAIAQNDQGGLQSTVGDLLSGNLDPYVLLETAEKGDAALRQEHQLGLVGSAAGSILRGGVNSTSEVNGKSVKGPVSLSANLFSFKIPLSIASASFGSEQKVMDNGGRSSKTAKKVALFNSVGIDVSVGKIDFNANGQGVDVNGSDLQGSFPSKQSLAGFGYKRNWDRLGANRLPKDGYTLEYDSKGIKKISWEITLDRTASIFELDAVKTLLAAQPSLRTQLEKLASFTTPVNRDKIVAKLQQLGAGATPNSALAATLASMSGQAAFLKPDDYANFTKGIDALAKLLPAGQSDIAELRSFMQSELWSNNKPIKLTLEATPDTLARVRKYDPQLDGSYGDFVNVLAQDPQNVRISSFAVNEARNVKTNASLSLVYLGYSSSAELSLKHDTATIKVFYSDPSLVTELKTQIAALAELALSSITDADLRAIAQAKLDATLDNVRQALGLDRGYDDSEAKKTLNASIRALAASIATGDQLDAVFQQLDALVAVDHPTGSQPNFTYSGERLVQKTTIPSNDVRAFNGFVQGSGNTLLLTLGKRYGIGSVTDQAGMQAATRQLLADLYAQGGLASSGDIEALRAQAEADMRRIKGIIMPSLLDQLPQLFVLDPVSGRAADQAALDKLVNALTGQVSAQTLDSLRALYVRHTDAVSELVASDAWRLYTSGAQQVVNLVNGELVYEYTGEGGDARAVALPLEMARRVIRSDPERILYSMSEYYTGALQLQQAVLTDADVVKLKALPNEAGRLASGAAAVLGADTRYQGLELLGLLDAIQSQRTTPERLDPAQRYMLTEFFADADHHFDRKALLDTVSSPSKYAQFRHSILQLRASGGGLDTEALAEASGRTLLEKVVSWDAVINSGAEGLNRAVDGVASNVSHKVQFAPQALYVGEGNGQVKGECAGLGLAYLHMLAQGDGVRLKNALLDGVFEYANVQYLAASDVDPSSREAAQSAVFRDAISQLSADAVSAASTDSKVLKSLGSLSLKSIVAQLRDASGNTFYQISTGNHAMVLAKKVVGSVTTFYFYDPNFADVELSAPNVSDAATALEKVVTEHLAQSSDLWRSAGGNHLSDYYAANTAADGKLVFNTSQFDVSKVASLPAGNSFASLSTLIATDGYVSERTRLEGKPNLTIAGIELAPTLLYDLGATVDGVRLTADMDLTQEAVRAKLRYAPAELLDYLQRQERPGDAEKAAKLLKKAMLDLPPEQRYEVLLGQDSASRAAGKLVLDAIDAKVSSALVVDPRLWPQLRAASSDEGLHTAGGEISSRIGYGLKAFGYYQLGVGVTNYLRRVNATGLRDQRAETDLTVNLAGIGYDLVQEGLSTGLARIGAAIASSYRSATTAFGQIAASIGRGVARAAGVFTGLLASGVDLYNVVTNFDRLSTARTPEERQDLIVNGSLSAAGAVVGVATVVAFAVGGAVASAAGPVGLAIGAVLALGGAIYSAVRQVQEVEQHITLTPLEKLTLGWTTFWGFGVDAATALRVETAIVTKQSQAERNAELDKFVADTLSTSSSGRGYDEVFYGNGAVQVAQYNYFSISVNGTLKESNVRREFLNQRLNYWAGQSGNSGDKLTYTENIYDAKYAAFAGIASTDDTLDLRTPNDSSGNSASVVRKTAATLDANNTALINLGSGTDTAYGYLDKKNLFTVSDGKKTYSGGNKDDIFILQLTTTPNVADVLSGFGGRDTVITQGLPNGSSGYLIDTTVLGYTIDLRADRKEVRYRTSGAGSEPKLATLSSIENAIGDVNTDDVLYGDDAANILDGAGGKDILDGGAGDDQLILRNGSSAVGGSGNDSFVIKRYVASSAGQATGRIDLRDGDHELSSIVLEYDAREIFGSTPTLDGNDIVFTLTTIEGGASTASMTLRLKDVYVDGANRSKTLRNDFVLLTRDGFTLFDALPTTLEKPADFTPAMRGSYALQSDKYYTDWAAAYRDSHAGKEPPAASIGVVADAAGIWSVQVSTDTTRTVTLPAYIGLRTEGSAFNDRLLGDAGNNILIGYSGNDSLSGGAGSDVYVVNADLSEISASATATSAYQRSDTGEKTIINSDVTQDVSNADGSISKRYDVDYLQIGIPREQLALRQEGSDVVLYYKADESRVAKIRLKDFMSDEKNRHIVLVDGAGATYGLNLVNGAAVLDDTGVLVGDVDGKTDSDPARDDVLIAAGGALDLYGGLGNDRLVASAATVGDTLSGDAGNDVLVDSPFNDILDAGEGNDVIVAGRGAQDLVLTGNGVDELRFTGDASGVKIVDSSATDSAVDTLWLPFAISALNYGRSGDHLVLQGQAPRAHAGELLTVVLKDYFKGSAYRNLQIKAYDGSNAALDLARVSSSLNLLGGSDYLSNSDALLSGASAFTISQRFSSSNTVASGSSPVALLSYALSGSTGNYVRNKELQVAVGAEGLSVWFQGTQYTGSGIDAAELLNSQMHTVSVSWDSASAALSVYLDGRARKTWTGVQKGGALQTGAGTLALGRDAQDPQGSLVNSYYQSLHGQVDALQVHNRALSNDELVSIGSNGLIGMNQAKRGQTAFWSLGTLDNVGDRGIKDLSGNNHALSVVSSRANPAPTLREIQTLTATASLASDALWQQAKLAAVTGTLLASTDVATSSVTSATEGDDLLVLSPLSLSLTGDYGYFDGLGGNDVIADFSNASAGLTGDNAVKHLIHGGSGNDEIHGSSDPANLYGDSGDDALFGGARADQLYGGDGDDRLEDFGSDNNWLDGGAGNDRLAGNGWLLGGAGSDLINGSDDGDQIYAESNDTRVQDLATDINLLNGFGGDDGIYGGGATDIIDGGSGNDAINAGAGNDVIYASAGSDTIDGGAGVDVLSFAHASRAVVADGGSKAISGGASLASFNSIEAFEGSEFDDQLTGGAGVVSLYGGSGNDTLLAAAGVSSRNINPAWAVNPSNPDDAEYAPTVLDVNGDHLPDLVLVNSSGVTVSLAKAGGGYQAAMKSVADYSWRTVVMDLNGDGLADVYDPVRGNGALGLAAGGFGKVVAFADRAQSDRAVDIAFADFNQDGIMDELDTSYTTTGIVGLLRLGKRTPATSTSAAGWSLQAGVVVGKLSTETFLPTLAQSLICDLDGDGILDALTLSYNHQQFSKGALVKGVYSFAAPVDVSSQDLFAHIGWDNEVFSDLVNRRVLADVNGDGKADLVDFENAAVWAAYGSGNGRFEPAVSLLSYDNSASYGLGATDVNQDGVPDFLFWNNQGILATQLGTSTVSTSLYGQQGNDTLTGANGADTLSGGDGDDTLNGLAGNDSYLYAAGDGNDVINETGGTDVLKLSDANGQSLSSNLLWFQKDNNDLKVLVGTASAQAGDVAGGTITIKNYYSSAANKIEEIDAGGSKIASASIEQLVSKMAGMKSFDYAGLTTSGTTIRQEVAKLWLATSA